MNREIIEKRVEKLQSFDGSEDWYGLLTGLADQQMNFRRSSQPHELVHSYFGTRLRDGDDFELATQALDQTPFGQSLRVFKSIYEIDYPEATKYHALVSMVGFSLEPVIHTLLTLQPAQVLLVLSRESEKFDGERTADDYIKFLIKHYNSAYTPEIEKICLTSTDIAEVFVCVHEKIKQFPIKGQVAVDVTGGKKSMDAAAFLAAAMHDGVSIYYVDYEDYNVHDGYPVWGTEFLNKLLNPYALFSVRDEHLIKGLWEKGNYIAVQKLVSSVTDGRFSEDVAKRYFLTEKRNRFHEIGKAAACYEAWNRFDYQEAGKSEFNTGSTYHGQVLEELSRCAEVFVDRSICEKSFACFAYKLATDRYLRGREAKQNGELNRAALCYTQAVEVLLKFAYSAERQEELERKKTLWLLNNLFNGYRKKEHSSIFRGEKLRCRIEKDVLNKRNDLSHHSCITQPLDITVMFDRMESAVQDFLDLFADIYSVSREDRVRFTRQALFLQLDDSLQFRVPGSADGELVTVV